jgi:hypothetical protein
LDLTSITRAIISPIPEKTDFRIDTLKPGDTLQAAIPGARKGAKTPLDFFNHR